MSGDIINYPFGAMSQGAVDMAGANRRVTDLQTQFQTAMQSLLSAWQSQAGSPQLQQVQQLWIQTNEEINTVLGRRSDTLEEAHVTMRGADQSAATYLDV
jgi:WXG100 family type VII secretion target